MITVATPVLVPIVTLFVKSKVLPFLNEKHKWLTPLIAIALGGGLDYVNTLLTGGGLGRSEEHTSELQSQSNLVCRLLLEKNKHLSPYGCLKTHTVHHKLSLCCCDCM